MNIQTTTIKDIIKAIESLKYCLEYKSSGFEYYGQQISLEDNNKFISEFEYIMDFSPIASVFIERPESLIKILDDNIEAHENAKNYATMLSNLYNELEAWLVDNYFKSYVGEIVMTGKSVKAMSCSRRINAIEPKKSWGKNGSSIDFKMIEVDDEYAYEIFIKKPFKSFEERIELLDKEILEAIREMLNTHDGKDLIYNEMLFDRRDLSNVLCEKGGKAIDEESLYKWQREAYRAWVEAGNKGAIESATGCGKTRYALFCIQELLREKPNAKVKIIVHTAALMENWRSKLNEDLMIPMKDISRRGDKFNGKPNKFTIFIEKSANSINKESKMPRYVDDTISDFLREQGLTTLVVADEAHHYESYFSIEKYKRIKDKFDEYKSDYPSLLNLMPKFQYIALSATFMRGYEKYSKLKDYFGDIVYRFSFLDALNEGIISPVNLIDVEYSFNDIENKTFQATKEALRNKRKQFIKYLASQNIHIKESEVTSYAFREQNSYRPEIDKLKKYKSDLKNKFGSDNPNVITKKSIQWMKDNELPADYLNMLTEYIGVYNRYLKVRLMAKDRRERSLEIIRRHLIDDTKKVILFAEYIDDVNDIYEDMVSEFGRDSVVRYHSELDRSIAKKNLNRIEAGDYRVICVPTAFDEGVDIPSMNIGIVFQGKHTLRQDVQRLGRVMRTSEGKKSAALYSLFREEYGEREFLEDFIGQQMNDLDEGGEKEKLKLINKRLRRYRVKFDDEVSSSEVVNEVVIKL